MIQLIVIIRIILLQILKLVARIFHIFDRARKIYPFEETNTFIFSGSFVNLIRFT